MKKLVLAMCFITLGLGVSAQDLLGETFRSIWNKYRIESNLPKINCNLKEFKTVQLTPDTSVYVYFTDGKDTTYDYFVLGGDEKIIPKYHELNTKFLFSETLDTIWDISDYFTEKTDTSWSLVKHMQNQDSILLVELYKKISRNSLQHEIINSDRSFLIISDFENTIEELKVSYTIDFYEVLDVSALHLPEDYGATIRPDYIDIKAIMVDPKTKKLLYPELTRDK
jgi:hypothetical protein